MGRHQLDHPTKIYRPADTGKHATVSRALDIPEGLEVSNPKTSGLRRVPLTVALMALGTTGTITAPAMANEPGIEAVADTPIRAASVDLSHPRVEVKTVAAETMKLAPAIAESNEVIVKSGDTVGALAKAKGVNMWEMLKANALGPWTLIFPGQKLVYSGPAAAAPAAPAAPVNVVTVRSGDTVGAIAKQFGVSMNAMLAANGLSANSVIMPGQKLVLTGPAKAVPAAPAPVHHTVPAPVKAASAAPAAPAPAPAPAPVTGGRAQAIVNAALAQVGETQDCVKMVADALAAVGIFHYKWPVEYYQIGYAVPAAQALPGDLVYYVNGGAGLAHIAVYIGNNEAVHGGWNGNQTKRFSVNVGSGPNFIRLR